MIETIENGMGLAVVRDILNRLIERVNELERVTNSYDDLDNRPAIGGVTLTSQTSLQDLRIPASALVGYNDLIAQAQQAAAQTAESTAQTEARAKLDGDLTKLPQREYELAASMLVVIGDDKGNAYKTTLGDLLDYLKHEVLKLNDQYLRVIK